MKRYAYITEISKDNKVDNPVLFEQVIFNELLEYIKKYKIKKYVEQIDDSWDTVTALEEKYNIKILEK